MILHVKEFQSSIPAIRDCARLIGDDCLTLAFVSEKERDETKKRFRFVATDDAVDHHDEIIAAGAFHEHRNIYMSNPVLLTQHQHRLPSGMSTVAGRTLELHTDKNPAWGIGQLIDTQVGKDHAAAIFSGAQRGISVGFRMLESDRQDGRRVITKGLLLEISLVSVGANPNALVLQYVTGKLAGYAQDKAADPGEAREWKAMVDELRSELDELKAAFAQTTLAAPTRSDPADLAAGLARLGKELQKT